MAKSQKTKKPFPICDQMKGVFWNSRGLGNLAKHRFLSDLVKEEQISFIALSETGRDDFPDREIYLTMQKRWFQICAIYSIWPSTISKQAGVFGRIGKHMLKGDSSVFNWRGLQYYEKAGR
jgi:hypothetical protein